MEKKDLLTMSFTIVISAVQEWTVNNMRLMDGDKYKADLLIGQDYLDEDTLLTVINVLDCQPTIDAVPVVRCKDCKHWEGFAGGSEKGFCVDGDCIMYEDDFCSYGERKE